MGPDGCWANNGLCYRTRTPRSIIVEQSTWNMLQRGDGAQVETRQTGIAGMRERAVYVEFP